MQTEKIYLAAGCFWGAQKYFSLIPGVITTQVGYANSLFTNPSYEQVCSGQSDAAEAVEVAYDPGRLALDELLFMFFDIIDPTSVNRQGNDRGRQYRSGIYYLQAADRPVIEDALAELAKRYAIPLAVECLKLQNFYAAEDYHQNYLDKSPGGYCHIDPAKFNTVPQRLQQLSAVRALDNLSWAVTQQAATEPPFENCFDQHFQPGIYVDVITSQALFTSQDKYDSGCGWPAFAKPLDAAAVVEKPDYTLGVLRIEVISADSGAHLGHVFDDGPKQLGGLRYCINSAALRFVPLAEMAAQGYGELIDLVVGQSLI